MSQSIASGTSHYVGASTPFTANPWTVHLAVASSAGQARKFVSVGKTTDLTQLWVCGLDISGGATNKPSMYISDTSGSNQALASAAIDTTGNWNFCSYVTASTSSRSAYLNGANKGSTTAFFADPAGINGFIVSGRITDYTSGIVGQIAHLGIWIRALSDTEISYLGTGGNPRAIKGLQGYWKFNSTDLTTVPDEIAANDLTVSGTGITAGTTNPNLETYCTSAAISSQSATQGSAYAGVTVTFDNVSSAYTVSLQQMTSSATSTTTSSAGTALREIAVASVTGFAADNYAKIGTNAPSRILAINVTANTLLLADDQTYSSGATVTMYTVAGLTISGLSTTNLSGTPTAAGTYNLIFFRATCNANSTLVADSNAFTLTVASSGGGSAGVKLVAGQFSGGFSGG